MKVFIQRVSGPTAIASEVTEDGSARRVQDSFEGPGLVVLLGWTREDEARADLDQAEDWLFTRTMGLRIFPDKEGKMNLSLADYLQQNRTQGGILWVPQFTLAGYLESGYRPSFSRAMAPAQARARFEKWVGRLQFADPIKNIRGHFGADMSLTFTNWGPVSLMLEK